MGKTETMERKSGNLSDQNTNNHKMKIWDEPNIYELVNIKKIPEIVLHVLPSIVYDMINFHRVCIQMRGHMTPESSTSWAPVAATITLKRFLSGMNQFVFPHISHNFATYRAYHGMCLMSTVLVKL